MKARMTPSYTNDSYYRVEMSAVINTGDVD